MELMKLEIRDDGSVDITGYVNAVERDSKLLPKEMCETAQRDFVEQIKAGVFGKALEENPNVRLMFNHERDIAEAEYTLEEDNIGLRATVHMRDGEVCGLAKSGKLTGWSFGFRTISDRWEDCGDHDRRYLTGLALDEVSLLTKTPAYNGTSIELRAYEEEPNGIPTDLALKIIETLKMR